MYEESVIGFSANNSFYRNHALSGTNQVLDIACLNSPTSNYSNVVYKTGIMYLMIHILLLVFLILKVVVPMRLFIIIAVKALLVYKINLAKMEEPVL